MAYESIEMRCAVGFARSDILDAVAASIVRPISLLLYIALSVFRLPAGLNLQRSKTTKHHPTLASIDPTRENIILVVHEASRTGAPILGWNIANRLAERYNIHTICLGEGPLLPEFAALSVAIYGPFKKASRRPIRTALSLRPLFARRQFRYAIINSSESRVLIDVCQKHGVPTLFLIHEFVSLLPAGSLEKSLEDATDTVFSTESTANAAQAAYPFLSQRSLHILPQGKCIIPEGDTTQKPLSRTLLENLVQEKSSGVQIVLGAGTVSFRKGVDLFITTASVVRRRQPDIRVRFIWVGGGYNPGKDLKYSAYLSEQVRQYGIADCVSFVDEVSDLDPLYGLADVFFMASRLDPLPNVSIDAASRGIPIVCFNGAGGTGDLMRTNEVTAKGVVEYLDTYAAANAIGLLLSDRSHRELTGEATRKLASVTFDMDRYTAQIDALGRSLRPNTSGIRGSVPSSSIDSDPWRASL